MIQHYKQKGEEYPLYKNPINSKYTEYINIVKIVMQKQ